MTNAVAVLAKREINFVEVVLSLVGGRIGLVLTVHEERRCGLKPLVTSELNHLIGNASLRDVHVSELHLAASDLCIISERVPVVGEFGTGGALWVHVKDDPDVVFVVNDGVLECVNFEFDMSHRRGSLCLNCLALYNMPCLVCGLLHVLERLLAISVAITWLDVLYLLSISVAIGWLSVVVNWLLVDLLDWLLIVAIAAVTTVATVVSTVTTVDTTIAAVVSTVTVLAIAAITTVAELVIALIIAAISFITLIDALVIANMLAMRVLAASKLRQVSEAKTVSTLILALAS